MLSTGSNEPATHGLGAFKINRIKWWPIKLWRSNGFGIKFRINPIIRIRYRVIEDDVLGLLVWTDHTAKSLSTDLL